MKTSKLFLWGALALMALPLASLAAECVGTGCEAENRLQAIERRISAAEAALEEKKSQPVPKKPEAVLECQTVTKDSEVLLYEDRVVVESDLTRKGYVLVSGGCSFPDWKQYEMPALVAGHPLDNKWVCSYKNARAARIRGYATFCRASLKDQ